VAGHAEDEMATGRKRSPAAPPHVLILGSVSRDVIRGRGRQACQIGGTVWFAGTTLAGLGLRVSVLTRLAAADRHVAEAFGAAGVTLHAVSSPVTTEFHNIYGPGGRDDRRQAVGALAPPIEWRELAARLDDVDAIYLGALHPGDIAASALELLLSRHRRHMAMDVQGFTRRIAGAEVRAEVAPVLARLLLRARTIKASRREAALITGEAAPEAAARRLAALSGASEVLVTCGADGALLAEGARLHREAAARSDGVDPTGAGDMLLAAYLARRLIGEAPVPSLSFAVSHTALRLADPARIVPLGG